MTDTDTLRTDLAAAHASLHHVEQTLIDTLDDVNEPAPTDLPEALTAVRAVINRQQAEIDKALELLSCFVHDDDPCWWDHNHSCQAHGFFYLKQGEKCPVQEVKDLLAAAESPAVTA